MQKFYLSLFLLVYLFSYTISESITVSGDVSGVWGADTVIVENDIVLQAGHELAIAPGANILFNKYVKFDVYGSLQAKGELDNRIVFKNRYKDDLTSFLWFTDNNFCVRGLYPGEMDTNDSYFTYRDVFEGKVHSNSDIWLQSRCADSEPDGFSNEAEGNYWPIFLAETTTAGNFTGNTTYPYDYDPFDIISDELMDEIMVTDEAPGPYNANWVAPWRRQTPEHTLPETAKELRQRCFIFLNENNEYDVIRAKLRGEHLIWQGGRHVNDPDLIIIPGPIYNPWNNNHPGVPDTIPVITVGMIEEARNRYRTSTMGPEHYRNDDNYLSPAVYKYIDWDEDSQTLALPSDGGIFVGCELWIEGYYGNNNGFEPQIVIGACGNIRITDNIYPGKIELDPNNMFDSPDDRFRTHMYLEEDLFSLKTFSLGLVSEEKIIVGYTPANYGIYVDPMGQVVTDGGTTVFAALAALGTDDNNFENTWNDGTITFEFMHPPASTNVWGEPFSHMVGDPNGWASFYPVDLDSDGDPDVMLDWNNPRDLQHLFRFQPQLLPGQLAGWLMHPALLSSDPYTNPGGGFQQGHYLYQAWEWGDNWEYQFNGYVIPNIKNRGTLHICGSIAQRVRGYLKRTPFEPSEGGSNGIGGSFEDYTAGDNIQNGYNRDYVYDRRFSNIFSNYIELPYYPKLTDVPNWEGIAFYDQQESNSSLMENCVISGVSTVLQLGNEGVITANNSPNLTLYNLEITGCSLSSFGNTFLHLNNSDIEIHNTTILSGCGYECSEQWPSLRWLSMTGSSPLITGCSFSNYSQGSASPEILCQAGSSPSMYNTILWNHYDNFVGINLIDDECNPLFSHCNVMNGINAFIGEGSGSNYDSNNLYLNNISTDPLFEYDECFILRADSPCIDAGTPDTTGLHLPPWDMAANHRIWDGNSDGTAVIDIGAYEYGSEPYMGINKGQALQKTKNLLITNYPNPFNPVTTIAFNISEKSTVRINIYNVKGQLVRELLNEEKAAGSHNLIWDGMDGIGNSMASGVYFCRIKYNDNISSRKMLLMK